MKENLKSYLLTIVFIFLLSLLADLFLMRSTPLIGEASARTREFEDNITIPANDLRALDLVFSEGDELELIFSIQVKQDLPIDIWFVDYANYVRFVDGNEFFYYIDGSGQELKVATKIVSVTQHGTYELVFANKNNETVEVYLTYDLIVYPIESEPPSEQLEEETPLWQSAIFLAPVMLVVGILIGLIVSDISRSKKADGEAASKKSLKKAKKRKKTKSKKKHKKEGQDSSKKGRKRKSKKKKPEEIEWVEEEEIDEFEEDEEADVEDEEEPEVTERAFSPSFCGHCGKPVDTPFCMFCGKAVRAPTTPLEEGSSET